LEEGFISKELNFIFAKISFNSAALSSNFTQLNLNCAGLCLTIILCAGIIGQDKAFLGG